MNCVSIAMAQEAVVLFDYDKNQDDELDLRAGTVILNVTQVLPHTHTHTHTYICTHMHTHTHTHTLTHALTHSFA